MNPIVKNVLAVIAGIVVGCIVNMGIINISGYIIPPPAGADLTTEEGLKAAMHLFKPIHFLMPFLAHALGTFAGAAVAALIAATRKMQMALFVGVFFLACGIAMVIMLPSPLWFNIVDLSLAYIPMGFLAGKFFTGKKAVQK